jgi:hypothetical protein
MVILKATSFLEGYKRDMGMTFRITRSDVLERQQEVAKKLLIFTNILKHGIYIYICFKLTPNSFPNNFFNFFYKKNEVF